MTPDQLAIVRALNGCSLQLGSGNKSFIRSMGALSEADPARPLTPRQEKWLYDLCSTYRRQLAPAIRSKAAELLAALPPIEPKRARNGHAGERSADAGLFT